MDQCTCCRHRATEKQPSAGANWQFDTHTIGDTGRFGGDRCPWLNPRGAVAVRASVIVVTLSCPPFRARRQPYTSTRFFERYRPKPRPPLASYIRRLSAQHDHDQLDKHYIDKIYNSQVMSIPPEPRARRSVRSENHDRNYVNNDFHELYTKSEKSFEQQERSNLLEDESSSNDDNTDYDKQMTKRIKETRNKEIQSPRAQTHSRTASPERRKVSSKRESRSRKSSEYKNEQTSFFWSSIIDIRSHPFIIAIIVILMYMLCLSTSEKHAQHTDNPNLLLCKSIEEVRAEFHNQELDIWNDISSAINEIISRTPKVPSIILLYANETNTMNCLATEIARVSSAILHTDGHMHLTPEEFGDDAGEIINRLNEKLPAKKVLIIRDILNINAKAIRALHNLCDRINPLIGEAIYILTMQTNDYELSQKHMAFVENQIKSKFSKSIDQDILMALVTRITDGAIISVKPEPHLRYC